MKLKPVLALSLAALALAACVAEPESRDLVTRTSSADARITYTISKYVEPFEIQGIFATHKLRSNLVIVEVDRDARIRYIGYPDDVQIELGNCLLYTSDAADD